MKLLSCLILFITIMSGSAASQEPDPFEKAKQTKEYREAYKKGAAEAQQEIKMGVVTLYSSGLQMSLEHLDQDTG